MRFCILILIITLTGCDGRSDFDKRYEASNAAIEREAAAMNAEIANQMDQDALVK